MPRLTIKFDHNRADPALFICVFFAIEVPGVDQEPSILVEWDTLDRYSIVVYTDL